MTNEIKEIIDYLKEGKIFLNSNECKILLDYITNLQNEISDLKDTIQNKNDCIGAYECIIEDRDKRIDKAVEYIEEKTTDNNGNELGYSDLIDYEELLDILKEISK